jgi:hypothetical protein
VYESNPKVYDQTTMLKTTNVTRKKSKLTFTVYCKILAENGPILVGQMGLKVNNFWVKLF